MFSPERRRLQHSQGPCTEKDEYEGNAFHWTFMNIRRVVPDINTNCMEESVKFYRDFLGMQLAMDWDGLSHSFLPATEPPR